MRSVFLYLIPLVLLISCKKENAVDCFKSNGAEEHEIRNLEPFRYIELNDKIELTVTPGPEQKVEVIAGKHIIKNISTRVSDGTLKVENLNKCNVVRGYKRTIKVNVTMPYLKSVLNNSVAKIEITGFDQDSIWVHAESSGDIHLAGKFFFVRSYSNGNGDMYLSGNCRQLFVYTNGTNFLNAQNLVVSDYLYIEALTKGNCYVNATELKDLEYALYNDGSIYYTGTPLILNGIFGSQAKGKVIKED